MSTDVHVRKYFRITEFIGHVVLITDYLRFPKDVVSEILVCGFVPAGGFVSHTSPFSCGRPDPDRSPWLIVGYLLIVRIECHTIFIIG